MHTASTQCMSLSVGVLRKRPSWMRQHKIRVLPFTCSRDTNVFQPQLASRLFAKLHVASKTDHSNVM